MAEIFKFPNGYNVPVYRKKDILDCIDKNIIDKDVALLLVGYCEKQANEIIKNGGWASIPFMGNIRIPPHIKKNNSEETQHLLADAKDVMSEESYVIFRKQVFNANAAKVKFEKIYRYILYLAVAHNKKLYKKLIEEKGELYANILLYTCKNITQSNQYYDENGFPIDRLDLNEKQT